MIKPFWIWPTYLFTMIVVQVEKNNIRMANWIWLLCVLCLLWTVDAGANISSTCSKALNQTSVTYPSSYGITNQYDALNRRTNMVDPGGTTKFTWYGYTNNVGNQWIAQVRGDSSYAVYTYDNAGQLKSAVGASGQSQMNLGYYYDAGWNLNWRTNNGTPTSFSVDNLNQLSGGPTSPYTYDSDGNLTAQNNNYSYTYDDEDRLVSMSYTATFRTDFKYDGLGRLRQRLEYSWNGSWYLSSTVNYVYDGRRVIQERDGNNTPTVSYTRGTDLAGSLEGAGGIGGLLARSHGYNGGNWSTHNYYHADGGGNITYIMNASQTAAATYKYDPFGTTLAQSGTLASANVYRFSSKEFHSASSLYFYGFRFYDPNLQRWLNRDPMGEEGGINLYTFVKNDPIGSIDALGLESDPTAPSYNPNDWRTGGKYPGNNNCCNYAYNMPGGTKLPNGGRVPYNLQPGELGGQKSSTTKIDCTQLRKRVKADFGNDPNVKTSTGGKCPAGYHAVKLWLSSDGYGFHMMRQDDTGKWSEKGNATAPVSKCDPEKPQEKDDQSCGTICVPNTYK